jgi:hypothetical protein
MTTELFNRLPKVSPDSMLARVLLAFLATAGFFYVNIMPALVDGLKVGLGFSNKQAGLVGSCNVYGAAGGAFLIVFSVRRINWRAAAHFFLLGLLSEVRWMWIAANIGTGITWTFVISHLLGMCSRFDQTGQTAVWAGFASKMGLASGPMLFSFIVGAGNYSALIAMALLLLAFATLASAIPAWVLDRDAVNTLPDVQNAQALP